MLHLVLKNMSISDVSYNFMLHLTNVFIHIGAFIPESRGNPIANISLALLTT